MGSQAAVEMCMSVAVGGSLAAEGPALLLEMGTVGEGERGGGPGAGGGRGEAGAASGRDSGLDCVPVIQRVGIEAGFRFSVLPGLGHGLGNQRLGHPGLSRGRAEIRLCVGAPLGPQGR